MYLQPTHTEFKKRKVRDDYLGISLVRDVGCGINPFFLLWWLISLSLWLDWETLGRWETGSSGYACKNVSRLPGSWGPWGLNDLIHWKSEWTTGRRKNWGRWGLTEEVGNYSPFLGTGRCWAPSCYSNTWFHINHALEKPPITHTPPPPTFYQTHQSIWPWTEPLETEPH